MRGKGLSINTKSFKNKILCVLSALVMFIASVPCVGFPQTQQQPVKKLKIGLALSGGGAMGFAHLGILEFLEKNGLKVDYIAGTSMGSIVGGLYCSGMSVEEIKQMANEIDWDNIFEDKPERKYISFYKKEESQKYFFDLELGVKKNGFFSPPGLSSGQRLSLVLASKTIKACKYKTFDDFPIPFRAVATDIVTGEKVVIGKGSLANAMRASMAVPMVFMPIEIDGRLLVDGGLVENLPVQTVKDMGADIIIAIDVSEPLLDRSEIKGILSVAAQTIKIYGLRSSQESAKLADLVIHPDLTGLSPVDFKKVDEFAKRGFECAEKNRVAFLQIFENTGQSDRMCIVSKEQSFFSPEFIKVSGYNRVSRKVIESKLKTRLKLGEKFDVNRFERNMQVLDGTGYFQSISFEPLRDAQVGKDGLLVNVVEKPWGPNYMHFGVFFRTDFSSGTKFNFLTNIDLANLNRLGGELRNDIVVGSDYKVYSEFYQPITYSQNFFIAPGFIYKKDYHDVYGKNDKGKSYKALDFELELIGGKFDVGYQIGNIVELRQGVMLYRSRVKSDTSTILFGPITNTFKTITSKVSVDTLNSSSFPTKGTYINFGLETSSKKIGSDQDYKLLSGVATKYVTLRDRHVISGRIKISAAFDYVPFYRYFYTGGFSNFAGYKIDQLSGRYVGVTRLQYMYKMFELPAFLGKGVYAMLWTDVGNVWDDGKAVKQFELKESGSLGVGLDTKAGPVYLVVSKAEREDVIVYLGIGNEF